MRETEESFIPSSENETVEKPESEKVKLEDENQVEAEREITRPVSEKSVMESVGMTPEEQKKFEFDKSANLKLGGLFEVKMKELTLSEAKKIVKEKPLDYDLPESMAERLTDEQIKKIIGENLDLREKIASGPEFAEVFHLNETFKKAKGNLDTSEKILFFKTVDKVTSQPELIKEIRTKLWESMEGADMDERATEELGEKDKYAEDRMEAYKKEEVEKIMVGEDDREEIERNIDKEIERGASEEVDRRAKERKGGVSKKEQEEIRGKEEEKRSALQAEAIKKVISEKKDRIEKALGRSVTDEEIIFLKNEKGKDLNEISLSASFFSKKIRLGDIEKKKTEFNQFLSGELAGMEDYFNDKTKDFEGEWDEKLEKVKDGIIEESLDEIPDETVQKIYRKRKSLRIGKMVRDKELGEDKEKIEGFANLFKDDGRHINKLLMKLGSEDNLTPEDFYKGVDGFANEDFRKYAKEQKMEHSEEKYSFLLLILKLMFGFVGNKK